MLSADPPALMPENLNRCTFMQAWIDFLQFEILISPYVLITTYYVGALGFPAMLAYLLMRAGKRPALMLERLNGWIAIFGLPPLKRRWLILLFLLALLLGELAWRMMFEFLLAYFQIRDALVSGALA